MPPSSPPTTALQIRDALEDHARERGDRLAVIDATTALTYGQLWQQARARSALLGPRPGTVCAVSATSTCAFFADVAAIWLAGGVPMPLDPKTPPPLRTAMTRRASTGTHTCHPWKAVLSVVGGTYRPLVTGGEPPTVARKAHAVGLGRLPKAGSTGGGRSVAMFASPMYLNGPFEFAARHLLLGGTVAILNRFEPRAWVQLAAAMEPSWVFLAPIQIRRLLDGTDPHDLRTALASVHTLMHSAAPCPPEVRARLLKVVDAHVVAEFYGAAEYDGTFVRADENHPGAPPIPGALLRVVDATGSPAPVGQIGVIEGASTAGMVCHYAGAPCTAADAWRTVGDHGTLDSTGRLTVTSVDTTGRAIVGGVNVALGRVHAVIAAHPDVRSCQVIPIPDDTHGQVISARLTTFRPLTAEALHAYCATHLRPAERPRHLHINAPDQPTAEETDHALSM
ncbi:class I adenylate-forming enzyme family protein [Micromonospora zamorensis]|uniref:Acyl--CoA ligase n=1 Tax=Micromonospora zamorensis TaxID=709883 RepID=A0ABZ1PHF6_9ACTN